MRHLAGITAKVKGSQYDGAMIIKAVWQKEALPDNDEPIIVKENRKMLVCKAVFHGESLIITMLLKHQVPEISFINDMEKQIDGLDNSFSEKDITDFVMEIGDTNPIHKSKNPVVPGLLLMEFIKNNLPASMQKLELSFRNAVFSSDKFCLDITENQIRLYGRYEFVTGIFV